MYAPATSADIEILLACIIRIDVVQSEESCECLKVKCKILVWSMEWTRFLYLKIIEDFLEFFPFYKILVFNRSFLLGGLKMQQKIAAFFSWVRFSGIFQTAV